MSVILDQLRACGITPRKAAGTKGGEYHSACPVCGGTDRFHVWPEQDEGRGSWWCRQCDKGGDAIQYLRDIEGMTYREACRDLGIEVRGQEPRRTPRPPSRSSAAADPEAGTRSPEKLWQQKAGAFVGWAVQQLHQSPRVTRWLAERGISAQTAASFGLGWNPGDKRGKDLFRERASWGLEPAYRDDGRAKKLWLPRGLVIPFFARGELHRVRIRTVSGEPRYYWLPGSGNATFWVRRTGGADLPRAAVIVETELDAVMIFEHAGDLVDAVALGSDRARPRGDAHAALREASAILVALDFEAQTASAFAWWRRRYSQAIDWPVPEGKDPGEAYQAGVDIREWVLAGLPPVFSVSADSRRNGPLTFELSDREVGSEFAEREAAPAPARPETVRGSMRELYELLSSYPARIELHPDGGIALREDPRQAVERWDDARRLSELVYGDDEIHARLRAMSSMHGVRLVGPEELVEESR
jgi:hypothetical protein